MISFLAIIFNIVFTVCMSRYSLHFNDDITSKINNVDYRISEIMKTIGISKAIPLLGIFSAINGRISIYSFGFFIFLSIIKSDNLILKQYFAILFLFSFLFWMSVNVFKNPIPHIKQIIYPFSAIVFCVLAISVMEYCGFSGAIVGFSDDFFLPCC